MSITYPEAQNSAASQNSAISKKGSARATANGGSALFPSGSAQIYDRAAKARKGKSTPLAWVAAPVAVILVGGAVYLSMAHHAAPIRAATTTASSTRTAPAPVAATPAPIQSQPIQSQAVEPATVPAATARTTHVIRTQTMRIIVPAARSTPAGHVARSSTTVSTTRVKTPAPTPVAAPADATPTPGNFAFAPSSPATSAPAADTTASTPVATTPSPQ